MHQLVLPGGIAVGDVVTFAGGTGDNFRASSSTPIWNGNYVAPKGGLSIVVLGTPGPSSPGAMSPRRERRRRALFHPGLKAATSAQNWR